MKSQTPNFIYRLFSLLSFLTTGFQTSFLSRNDCDSKRLKDFISRWDVE
jgi:hypothetical protein